MVQTQRQILVTACAAHGLIHVYELAIPALLILIQLEFGVGDLDMGRVVTLAGFLFGAGALPAGYLVDRLGSKRLLLFCLFASSLSLLALAASPSFSTFTISVGALGLGLSIYHPAGTALITHSLPVTGRNFAWHGMAGNTGVAMASVISGSLGYLVGWRWTLALLAVFGLVVGAMVLRLPEPTIVPEARKYERGRWSSFVLLLVAAVFLGIAYRGVTTFLPKLFAINASSDPGTGTVIGGALTTAALLLGLVGMYVAGRLIDRGVRASWVFLAAALFQMPFLIAIGYIGGPMLLPLAMGVSFFHFMSQPAGNLMVSILTPPQLRGLGYGIYFFIGFGAGSVGSTISGWISEREGLAFSFTVLAAFLLPAIAAMLAIIIMRRKR
jgi:MFS family permease